MIHGKRHPTRMMIQKRLLLMFSFCFLLAIALIIRLGWIQLVVADELTEKARDQWNRSIPVSSPRGNIYDRCGRLLAGNTTAETVVAIPPQIDDPEMTARILSPILGVETGRLYELMTQDKAAVYLKRMVSSETADEVRLHNLPGITFTQESKRFYPNGTLFSQLLGFVGTDQGWSGLEIYYEEELQGRDGRIVAPTDLRGREVPGVRQFISPKEGLSLYLTVDETIQFIVERELGRAMVEYSPDRIIALAVNPKTGEVLAAAGKPDFDPNEYAKYNQDFWRLYSVTDSFEPGSTFKVATLAAAIEENLYSETEAFYCSGSLEVADTRIHCWSGGHGSIDFLEAVKGSCNPAFITLGQRLGKETLFHYIHSFGFGETLGIDYPGEATGLVFEPEQVGPVELATTSFGQGITVTPLQQVMFVSAIANGGKLLRPYLVKEIRDTEGKIVQQNNPQLIRRILSQETTERVTSILEQVVQDGSGINASIEGYRIAGKTGTAQKVGPQGSYLPGDYVLSFIGFAPVEDPQIVLYIAVDGARKGALWGSQISAPIFRRIMIDVFKYLEIAPTEQVEREIRTTLVPNLQGMDLYEAAAVVDTEGLVLKPVGEGSIISKQIPQAGTEVPLRSNVIVFLQQGSEQESENGITLPSLHGLTIREVGEVLKVLDLSFEIEGSGVVVEQEPPPGEVVEKGTSIKVYFSSPQQ
ncbi:MAG: PASTA domain-containing protein [Firmicutes bacterium]|nr:PASTA domain-containing protein [Bacillota bacterium]